MPATQRDLLDSRRRMVLANAILWGNAHYDDAAGLALAADRHGHTIGNVRYAAALIEATAEALDVGFAADAARTRAAGILTRLLSNVRDERSVPRYLARHAPLLPVRIACDRVLWPLAYLADHRERLGVTAEVIATIEPVVSALQRAHERLAEAGRRGQEARLSGGQQTVWDMLRQAAGTDVHWSALSAPGRVPSGPFPWPCPDKLALCPDERYSRARPSAAGFRA